MLDLTAVSDDVRDNVGIFSITKKVVFSLQCICLRVCVCAGATTAVTVKFYGSTYGPAETNRLDFEHFPHTGRQAVYYCTPAVLCNNTNLIP